MNFGQIIRKQVLNANVIDWGNRVLTNGGSKPSFRTMASLSNFYNTINEFGLLPKMKAINCIVPDNLIAAQTPLVKTYGNDPWTNVNFLASSLTVAGIVGNGSTMRLDTGVAAATAFPDFNIGMTLYITVNNSGTVNDCAVNSDTTQSSSIQIASSYSNTCYWDSPYGNGTGRFSTSNANYTGYISGNRTSITSTAVYIAKSSVAHTTLINNTSTTLAGAVLPFHNFNIACWNNVGSYVGFTSHRYSFAAFHAGMTAVESKIFFDAIQKMRQQIGGGFA